MPDAFLILSIIRRGIMKIGLVVNSLETRTPYYVIIMTRRRCEVGIRGLPKASDYRTRKNNGDNPEYSVVPSCKS